MNVLMQPVVSGKICNRLNWLYLDCHLLLPLPLPLSSLLPLKQQINNNQQIKPSVPPCLVITLKLNVYLTNMIASCVYTVLRSQHPVNEYKGCQYNFCAVKVVKYWLKTLNT